MRIEELGIIPALRPPIRETAADDVRFAAETLYDAGIPIAEISMLVPGALAVISHLAKTFPKMILGADVLDVETARSCVAEGVKFLTTPGFVRDVVEFANHRGIVVFPGALTPTEVIVAWNAGADYVKVFPCAPVGGPSYIKALHGPFPQVPLIASGGVNERTAGNFILAGATALGIGAELVPAEALRSRKEEQIRELARRFLNIVTNNLREKLGAS
jgi:2-dehydro-3-deoxyphosphogluconate aldolase/(4S)-4-hydroxy-2-oxoglutarate aldolase